MILILTGIVARQARCSHFGNCLVELNSSLFLSKPTNPNSGACRKSVGPIPAVLGQRSEGAKAEEQGTTDDGHESRRNRIEAAGG